MSTNDSMICVEDFEKFARQTLPSSVFTYYRSGANHEFSLRDNVAAFRRWRLLPRCLVDVSQRDLSTSVLEHRIAFPVCVAPTALQRMAHPDGEVANAKAAASMATIFTLSTDASSTIEEVAKSSPDGLKFFQLYVFKERDLTVQLVRRAEKAGYKALVLTVDTPVYGVRYASRRNPYKVPPHLKLANTESLHYASPGVTKTSTALIDPSATWECVEWLLGITTLPVVIKGVLRVEDALKAVSLGVGGILVSNHGARQLDTVPATLDVLEGIVAAVAGRCEVYLDGGVRCGTDVLKALALGARAVFVGRPALYGLAYDGEAGVKKVLDILRNQFDTAMALTGCPDIASVSRSLVAHETSFVPKL